MHLLRSAAPVLLVATLTACGGSDESVAMPDVTGDKLDVAYEVLDEAGTLEKDDIVVEGGGMFGVVMEGNWTVCDQKPAAGDPMPNEPTLIVDRSCDDLAETDVEEEPSEDPVDVPTESETPSEAPTEEEPSVLTVDTSPELAALLNGSDYCSRAVASFAKSYSGREIEFDGAVVALAPHGNYNTRFDFLINAGDFDPNVARGPSFQFRDKNVFDLNLTGKKIPDSVKVGQNYTFVAEVEDFSRDTCLFQLNPVETKVR
ncbi:MAG: DUF4839 domain-containing protein [Nocardioides marinisabuli]|uniref:DUF4839 domain-containing protein n=1 Tax=Nocardioides marinisabuli TaxID=419476 RepID=UPI00321AF07F